MQFSQWLKSWRVSGSTLLAEWFGGMILHGPTRYPLTAVAYSAAMDINASLGGAFMIAPTNNVAFTINAPTNPPAATQGQVLSVTVKNASGGALGVATWNAVFRLSAWTQPANGFSRTITFQWNGTQWVESSRTTVDVPN
jgi:hypothetical protein